MGCNTYEMLSLLSCAVSCMPDVSASSLLDAAKTLLHKCISQFMRQQQIHAQQAVWYLHGFGDGIFSHKTVPMLSLVLMSFLRFIMTSIPSSSSIVAIENNEEEMEELSMKII